MTAWYKDSAGHARAGRLGGLKQGKKTNPANFARDRKRASLAGKKSGEARRRTPKVHTGQEAA